MTQKAERYTITISGDSAESREEALHEALRLMRDGCTCGADRNENGGFYFESTDHVPKKEWPA